MIRVLITTQASWRRIVEEPSRMMIPRRWISSSAISSMPETTTVPVNWTVPAEPVIPCNFWCKISS